MMVEPELCVVLYDQRIDLHDQRIGVGGDIDPGKSASA
jgi:hypothetical protein